MNEVELSIGKPMRAITTNDFITLGAWCREYNRRNKFPTPPNLTFAIGFYQIHQGMAWKDGGVNKYESYAAAIVHFLRVAEQLDLNLENVFPFLEFANYSYYLNFTHVLYHLSAAQQQLYYAVSKTKRGKNRYSRDVLVNQLGEAIVNLMRCIPVELRILAIYTATKIIAEELK